MTIRSYDSDKVWMKPLARALKLSLEEQSYIEYHAERIDQAVALVSSLVRAPAQKILDVGPHFLTVALAHELSPRSTVIHTLGWRNERVTSTTACHHHEIDLNSHFGPDELSGPYDGIVLAETIEHLYTSPKLLLSRLASCLSAGGWLLVQTPNAASLTKRVKLALGNNPYEMIREDMTNPGHYREYTLHELIEVGSACGLLSETTTFANYWRSPGWRGLIEDKFPSLRNGLTVIFRKS